MQALLPHHEGAEQSGADDKAKCPPKAERTPDHDKSGDFGQRPGKQHAKSNKWAHDPMCVERGRFEGSRLRYLKMA
ncbi:hypothetical protein GCM10010924_51090 [Rhizobium wenxiniae]|nr:hypothetical protein GCM10010924_51090 [Rhizobium wenxiniae]